MADAKVTTTYVQQEQIPGGWEDNAETDDRELAESRYKAFAASRERTRLIERTERVLAEGPQPKRKR
jgi:hypothetical protein